MTRDNERRRTKTNCNRSTERLRCPNSFFEFERNHIFKNVKKYLIVNLLTIQLYILILNIKNF